MEKDRRRARGTKDGLHRSQGFRVPNTNEEGLLSGTNVAAVSNLTLVRAYFFRRIRGGMLASR
jgi:hypothetical protein